MVETEQIKEVLIQGEKIEVAEGTTVTEAMSQLNDFGFGDYMNGREPVVQNGVLMFEQQNAEKGLV